VRVRGAAGFNRLANDWEFYGRAGDGCLDSTGVVNRNVTRLTEHTLSALINLLLDDRIQYIANARSGYYVFHSSDGVDNLRLWVQQ
jgi:hypothetical protein